MNINREGMCKKTRERYDMLMEKEGFPELLESFKDTKNRRERDKIFKRIYKEYQESTFGLTSSYAPLGDNQGYAIAYTEYEEICHGKKETEHSAIWIYTGPCQEKEDMYEKIEKNR